ncbi:hypothetical protein KP509_03G036600 [Ceratopteris richardii]|uniref:RRM domain-containing protein n=1 Tax=Ceratopteris richardii TaxID=49495 RepID=A0A8T2V2K9_CERRI|nr:hypothetical protein KP509_03G036600 [Ceratopteris richardii]
MGSDSSNDEDQQTHFYEESRKEHDDGNELGQNGKKDRNMKKKEKQKQKLLRQTAKAKNRGVCYLSRIPPHLKPLKLRHLLSQYGEVLRIYLAPEDHAVKLRRKLAGKNTGKNFTEGWVEFANKKDAKRIAKMLNGEPMGGKKRSAYYYDLWNIKYLKKFKWDNLTEEIAYKNAVREQKQAADISAAKRERDFYLSKVDQSKAISAMEERKLKRQRVDDPSSVPDDDSTLATGSSKFVRHFTQKKSVADRGDDGPRLSQNILVAVLGRK